ncbi:MAG: hypothetical protein DRR16_18340, partial [Candidatus Parabeggiatoa sp. nov. 3]
SRLFQTYNKLGRLTEQQLIEEGKKPLPKAYYNHEGSEPTLIERVYQYDQIANLITIDDQDRGKTYYTYDLADRLLKTQRQPGIEEEFAYDRAGNLTQINETILTYATGNRLLKQGEIEYIYDDNGRLIQKIENTEPPKIWEYSWDGNDDLSSITTPKGDKWTYKYDALGRRILKQGPDKTVRFIWNGNVIIHILENDKLDSTWIHQPRTFKPLCTLQNDQVYSVILDHLGTPQELIDTKGKIVWLAHYQTWGKVESIDTAQKKVDCPIRFPGQWFDDESGLHYNRFRYYDPQTGRFISQDPIGLIGGLNSYWYAKNPVSWMDVLGLQKRPCSIFNFSLESKLHATLEKGSPECQKNMQEELQQILGVPRGFLNAGKREVAGFIELGEDYNDLKYWYFDSDAAIEVLNKYFKAGGAIVDDPSIILDGIFGPTLDALNREEYGEAGGEFAALLVFGILDPLKGGGKAGKVGSSINRIVPDAPGSGAGGGSAGGSGSSAGSSSVGSVGGSGGAGSSNVGSGGGSGAPGSVGGSGGAGSSNVGSGGALGKFDNAINQALQGQNQKGELFPEKTQQADAKMEGKIAQALRPHLVAFQKGVPRLDGTPGNRAEIDIETPNFIVEVTTSKGGKVKQIKDRLSSPEANPQGKPIIVLAPNMKRHAIQSSLDAGAIAVVQTEQELLDFMKKNGGP